MIPVEKIEIGMEVMTKNHGEGKVVDLWVSDLPAVYAVVETESGTYDYPLAWLSQFGKEDVNA